MSALAITIERLERRRDETLVRLNQLEQQEFLERERLKMIVEELGLLHAEAQGERP